MGAMLTQFFANRILRAGCGLLPAAVMVWVFVACRPAHAQTVNDATAERAQYSQKVSEHYSFRFGANLPFLPSNAATDTGQFIDPSSFLTAQYCGHCHQEAYAQ
jgi:hypothetical protein